MQAISLVTITTLLDNLVKYNTFLTSMWLVQEVVLWKQLVVVEDTCQYSSRHLPHTVLGVLEFPPHLPHPLCQRVDSTLTDYTIL